MSASKLFRISSNCGRKSLASRGDELTLHGYICMYLRFALRLRVCGIPVGAKVACSAYPMKWKSVARQNNY